MINSVMLEIYLLGLANKCPWDIRKKTEKNYKKKKQKRTEKKN